ncbi:MAG TPA: VOC family protein [Bryobacteraceae bacterium]|nr:VOC family protein [Bryobacteraceae bacterium]
MRRRDLICMLGAGAIAVRRAVAADTPALRFTALDHVEFLVSDVEKSAAFYARVFGNTVLKNNKTTRRYVKIGASYLAMDKGEMRVDHFCAGIPGFQVASVHSFLDAKSIAYRDFPSGKDLAVADLDGTRLQLATDNGWAQLLTGTASPETISSGGEAIFHPTGIDHILLNVTDPETSVAFYEKILGPVTQRNNNRIWFQAGTGRIGLLKTPAGEKAGVNHYCVAVEKFDYDTAVKKLQQAGVKLDMPEIAGAPDLRDPDGYRVQVMGPRA